MDIGLSVNRFIDSFGQYFTQMGSWLALPPNKAINVKPIPTLVLLDEFGNLITTDAHCKIPLDKAGISFPWMSPVSVLISTILPRSFRLMVKGQRAKVLGMIKRFITGRGTKLRE